MFHINKQMVSSPSSSVFFFFYILLLLPSPFPGERKLLAHVHGLLSHDVWTALTVILADLSVCVCVYLGVCVCCMLVFVSVKLVWAPVCRQQPAGWVVPMTLWHMLAESILFRQHSLRLCEDLLTHTEEVEHTVGLLMSTYLKWQRCLFQQNHFAILNQIATVSLSQW